MKSVFVVGGSGYVGEMLCHQMSLRDDVDVIVSLDKEPQSDFSKNLEKVKHIQMNMADDGWQEQVRTYRPEVVIHTAWQIRAMYGQSDEQWRWNVDGSAKVFDFALSEPSVRKFIYYSTASSYAARIDNDFNHYFTEEEGFREDGYIYAKEKKVTEEMLFKKFNERKLNGKQVPRVVVFRPAAITGPRGRYMRIRFGLQSALQGNLKGGFFYKLVTLLTTFVPATKGWVRQFIHEDDVNDATIFCATTELESYYEVFNLTPTSEPVYAKDMAKAVGKKIVPVSPLLVRIAFWFLWHLTRGRIPTCPGSWRFYSYPVLMSGKKLSKVYTCKYTSRDAFKYTDGRYEEFIPNDITKLKNERG
jgi:nucleoside-diphosphate-sugar epimerase